MSVVRWLRAAGQARTDGLFADECLGRVAASSSIKACRCLCLLCPRSAAGPTARGSPAEAGMGRREGLPRAKARAGGDAGPGGGRSGSSSGARTCVARSHRRRTCSLVSCSRATDTRPPPPRGCVRRIDQPAVSGPRLPPMTSCAAARLAREGGRGEKPSRRGSKAAARAGGMRASRSARPSWRSAPPSPPPAHRRAPGVARGGGASSARVSRAAALGRPARSRRGGRGVVGWKKEGWGGWWVVSGEEGDGGPRRGPAWRLRRGAGKSVEVGGVCMRAQHRLTHADTQTRTRRRARLVPAPEMHPATVPPS